jgi:16S rRNA (uracil1498-N3)-methyltransferase
VKLNLSLSRLQKIIVEAAEQSGRGLVPTCLEPVTFEEALQKASTNTTNFFFSTASEIPFSKALVRGDVLGIFVGPEGGWSPEEETLAREHHCVICSLGKLTLRAETAAIVASYVVLH